MKSWNGDHPSNELLTAYALGDKNIDIDRHIKSCQVCSRYIKEISSIKGALQSLPDEEMPENLQKSILKSIKERNCGIRSWFDFRFTNWYNNLFIIILGLIALVIFLYMFFIFML